ncbi:MAG: hypothetical protein ABIR27_06505 [Dokdonella sp.]
MAIWLPAAIAAEGAEPPLEVLFAKQNMLVAGKLLEINPSGRLVFAMGERLSGQTTPPRRIDLRVPKQALAQAKIGTRYVFGYTLYTADMVKREMLRLNPAGPVMLMALGIEPAMFEDSRQLRSILRAGNEEEGAANEASRSDRERSHEQRRLWQRLMKALSGKDRALQNLAASQIVMDPEFRNLADKKDQEAFRKLALDSQAWPSARRTLLVGAWRQPDVIGDWGHDAAQQILETTPIGGYASMAQDPSELVLAAFNLLAATDSAMTPELVSRWIESETPLLAEKALLTIRQFEPTREHAAIRIALAKPDLPAQTRKFLDDHLRRLNLLDARLREQKEGSH